MDKELIITDRSARNVMSIASAIVTDELNSVYAEKRILQDRLDALSGELSNKKALANYWQEIAQCQKNQKMELMNKIDDFKSLSVVVFVVVVGFYLMVI